MAAKKVHKRLGLILLNAARNLLPMFVGMVLGLFVVRLLSPSLWGEFVAVQVWVFLLAHLAGWGATQHLLIRFSKKPGKIPAIWAQNLLSRLPLLFFTLLLLLLPASITIKLLAMAWAISRFLELSFEAPIIYSRRFKLSIITDAALYFLLFLILYLRINEVQLEHILAGMATIAFSKAIIFSVAFKYLFRARQIKFSLNELKHSLPFFLLGFSGLLQSKIDLYLVTAMLPPADVSLYQVYLALLFLLLGIPNLLIVPFAKNYYRMGSREFMKLRRKIMFAAIPAIALGMPAIWAIVHYLYLFQLNATLFISGILFILPMFFYSPIIHQMFRLGKQKIVVAINFCGFVLILIPGFLLVNFFGIAGALAAAAANQWAMLAAYQYFGRSRATEKTETLLTEPQQ